MAHINHDSPHPDAPPPSDPLFRFWPAPGKRVRVWTRRKGYWDGVLGRRQEYPEFPELNSWEVFATLPDSDAGNPPSYLCVNAMEGFNMLDAQGKTLHPCRADGYPDGLPKPR